MGNPDKINNITLQEHYKKHTETEFNPLGLQISYYILKLLFRKIPQIIENIEQIRAIKKERLIYCVAPHSSWLDTIILPFVLKDRGLKHPRSIAGINSKDGIWGYIQEKWYKSFFVDRSNKDINYFSFLKSELPKAAILDDIILFFQGGRSYSGHFKPMQRLAIKSFCVKELSNAFFVPVSITYDIVLEDEILYQRGVKKKQLMFGNEFKELIRFPAGPIWHYKSKVYLSFGKPLIIKEYIEENKKGIYNNNIFDDIKKEINNNRKITETALLSYAIVDGSKGSKEPFSGFISKNVLEDRINKYISMICDKSLIVTTEPTKVIEIGEKYFKLRNKLIKKGEQFYIDNSKGIFNFYANTIEDLIKKQ
ncbi:MAG: 1-acyl-sn-glycerol-3-phosphate acyltransferase [Candidatus Woesearchaeota archaeon]